MPYANQLPLFGHDLASPSEFTAEDLMQSVRNVRNLPEKPVPAICILEFDGDLTDWLISKAWQSPSQLWVLLGDRPRSASIASGFGVCIAI